MAALAFVFLMATAVEARAAAAEPPSISVLVPVVGSVAGIGVVWKTDVELRNDTSQEATVALSLPAAVDEPTILLTLPAGGVQRFTDVVGEAFGMAQALSPLRVQTLGRHSVRVTATVYGVRGADFTVIVETGSHDTYVYGSVIDNRTSDARFIPPALGAPSAQDADRQTQ